MNLQNALVALVALTACTPALSSLQPAAVLKKGQVHTAIGVGSPLPVGQLIEAAQDAGLLQNKKDKLSAAKAAQLAARPTDDLRPRAVEDAQGAFAAALGAFLFASPPVVETSLKMGLGHNLDGGLRLSTDSIAVEGKWQFLGSPEKGGFDGSVGLGASFHLFNSQLFNSSDFSSLSAFGIQDINRFDISVPVTFGRQPTESIQYWYGPKYVFSKFEIQSALLEAGPEVETIEGNLHYLGGTAGIALGYKRAWFVMEVTALNLFFKEEIAGREEDLGGLIVYPAAGFMTRF
jgi:hypothetical protein